MAEESTAPAATPIQNKAPKPPGLMPKNVQAWVMVSLAVLMVLIMWLTGGKKPPRTPSSNVSTFQPAARPGVNEAQVAALQNRIQQLQQEQESAIKQQNKFFGSLPSGTETPAPAQASGPAPEPATPNPIQAEEQRREYVSLFSSNVALSYRKDQQQQATGNAGAPNTSPGLAYPSGQQPPMSQLAPYLGELPPMLPQAPYPAPSPLPKTQQTVTATSENPMRQKPQNSAASGSIDAATGKTYILFEGTTLDTVLLNRLNGDFPGPVECMVTSNIYSHSERRSEDFEVVVIHFVAQTCIADLIQTLELVEVDGIAVRHDQPVKRNGKASLAECVHGFRLAEDLSPGRN